MSGADNETRATGSQTPSAETADAVAAPRLLTRCAAVQCPACGNDNSLDSRFCRHCGTVLTGPAPAPVATITASPTAAPAPVPVATVPGASATSAAPAASPQVVTATAKTAPRLSPAQVAARRDARRSRQLLDQALELSERGERGAALLACRQAIALTPRFPAGYSMLGLLLERHGDAVNAAVAYEKVLALAPESPLERDSLLRLRGQTAGATTAPPKSAESALPLAAAPVVVATAAVAPLASAPLASAPLAPAPLASAPSVSAPVAAAAGARLSPNGAQSWPGLQPPQPSQPSQIAPAAMAAGSATVTARPAAQSAPRQNYGVPGVAPLAGINEYDGYLDDYAAVSGVPRWLRAVHGESSFYIQVAPLLLTAALSMAFLLWARGIAVSHALVSSIDTAPSITAPAVPGQAPAAPSTTAAGAATTAGPAPLAAPPPAMPANQPVSVTNAPAAATTLSATAPPSRRNAGAPLDSSFIPARRESGTATRTARPASDREAGGGAASLLSSIPPMPVRPLAEPAPPPIIALPQRSARQTPAIVPLFGPAQPVAGDSGGMHGMIRITGSGVSPSEAPARPEIFGRNAENAARVDAAGGNTDNAISRTTSAIESGHSDTGWRYQQRALLRLEKGDNGSAADDFQTAIAAYRDQMAQGIRVDEARTGISACQSGLRLAQTRQRSG